MSLQDSGQGGEPLSPPNSPSVADEPLSPPGSPSERPPSPDHCTICLSKVSDKAFTDKCFHTFCYRCLQTWSNVKAVCPLCKQKFKSIYHNVQKESEYDEYIVENTEDSDEELSNSQPVFGGPAIENFMNTVFSFFPSFARSNQTGNNSTMLPTSSSHVNFTTPRPMPPAFPLSMTRNVQYVQREEVYRHMLKSVPPEGQYAFRNCTPQVYSQDAAEMRRLSKWIVRELKSIKDLMPSFDASGAMNEILRQLPRISIQDNDFYRAINPYMQQYTGKFIQELYQFARSSYDMYDYDRVTSYEVRWDLPIATIPPHLRIPFRVSEGRNVNTANTFHETAADDDDCDVVLVRSPWDSVHFTGLNTNSRGRSGQGGNSVMNVGEFQSSLAMPVNNLGTGSNTNSGPTRSIDISLDAGNNAASGQNAHRSNYDSDDCVIVEPLAVGREVSVVGRDTRRDTIVISDTEEEAESNARPRKRSRLVEPVSPIRPAVSEQAMVDDIMFVNNLVSEDSDSDTERKTSWKSVAQREGNVTKAMLKCTPRSSNFLTSQPSTLSTDFQSFNQSHQRNCPSNSRSSIIETDWSGEFGGDYPTERSTTRESSDISSFDVDATEELMVTPQRHSRSIKKTPRRKDGACEMPYLFNEGNSSSGPSGSRVKQQRSTSRKKDQSLECSEKYGVAEVKKHLLTCKTPENCSHKCHIKQRPFLPGPARHVRSTKRSLSSAIQEGKEEAVPDNAGFVSSAKGRGMNSEIKAMKSTSSHQGIFGDYSSAVEKKKEKNLTGNTSFVLSSNGRGMNLETNSKKGTSSSPIIFEDYSSIVQKRKEKDLPGNASFVLSPNSCSMNSETRPKKYTSSHSSIFGGSLDPFRFTYRDPMAEYSDYIGGCGETEYIGNLYGAGRSGENLETTNSFTEYRQNPYAWNALPTSDQLPQREDMRTQRNLPFTHNHEEEIASPITGARHAGLMDTPEYGSPCTRQEILDPAIWFLRNSNMMCRCSHHPDADTISSMLGVEDDTNDDDNAHHTNNHSEFGRFA